MIHLKNRRNASGSSAHIDLFELEISSFLFEGAGVLLSFTDQFKRIVLVVG